MTSPSSPQLVVTAEGDSLVVEGDTGTPVPAVRDAVRVEAVSHVYESRSREDVLALDDVSLTVSSGSFVSLIGPSGCGKSTLLKVVGGLIRSTSGQVLVEGRVVEGADQSMGYMFQSSTLLPWRSVISNVLLPLEVRSGKRGVESGRDRAHSLLEMCGLAEFAHSYPRELSGGMAQRVAICRMLVTNPSILLLDEPFGALDELTRERMNLELQTICMRERATTLMVTHSIAEAVLLSDEVLVMSNRPATIAHRIPVTLPRPRTGDDMATPDFARLVKEVRDALEL